MLRTEYKVSGHYLLFTVQTHEVWHGRPYHPLPSRCADSTTIGRRGESRPGTRVGHDVLDGVSLVEFPVV